MRARCDHRWRGAAPTIGPMETGRHAEVDIRVEPAVLVGVRLGGTDAEFEASLEELRSLAETAGVRVVGTLEQRRAAPRGSDQS